MFLVWLLAMIFTFISTQDFVGIVTPDTHSYQKSILAPWVYKLSNTRTLGYPAFLSAVGFFNPGLETLVYLQFLSAIIAVLMLYWSLALSSIPRSLTVVTVASIGHMLLSRPQYFHLVATDFLGLTLFIMAISCLIRFIAAPLIRTFAAACLFGFAAYHIRPSYLFFVLLAFLTGISVWRQFKGRVRVQGIVTTFIFTFGLLFGYFAIRKAYTGEFSLVSFDGYVSSVLATELALARPDAGSFLNADQLTFLSQVAECRKKAGIVPAIDPALNRNPYLYSRQYTYTLFECHENIVGNFTGYSGKTPYFPFVFSANKFFRTYSAQVFEHNRRDLFRFSVQNFLTYIATAMGISSKMITFHCLFGLILGAITPKQPAQVIKTMSIFSILFLISSIGSTINITIFSPIEHRYIWSTQILVPIFFGFVSYIISNIAQSKHFVKIESIWKRIKH